MDNPEQVPSREHAIADASNTARAATPRSVTSRLTLSAMYPLRRACNSRSPRQPCALPIMLTSIPGSSRANQPEVYIPGALPRRPVRAASLVGTQESLLPKMPVGQAPWKSARGCEVSSPTGARHIGLSARLSGLSVTIGRDEDGSSHPDSPAAERTTDITLVPIGPVSPRKRASFQSSQKVDQQLERPTSAASSSCAGEPHAGASASPHACRPRSRSTATGMLTPATQHQQQETVATATVAPAVAAQSEAVPMEVEHATTALAHAEVRSVARPTVTPAAETAAAAAVQDTSKPLRSPSQPPGTSPGPSRPGAKNSDKPPEPPPPCTSSAALQRPSSIKSSAPETAKVAPAAMAKAEAVPIEVEHATTALAHAEVRSVALPTMTPAAETAAAAAIQINTPLLLRPTPPPDTSPSPSRLRAKKRDTPASSPPPRSSSANSQRGASKKSSDFSPEPPPPRTSSAAPRLHSSIKQPVDGSPSQRGAGAQRRVGVTLVEERRASPASTPPLRSSAFGTSPGRARVSRRYSDLESSVPSPPSSPHRPHAPRTRMSPAFDSDAATSPDAPRWSLQSTESEAGGISADNFRRSMSVSSQFWSEHDWVNPRSVSPNCKQGRRGSRRPSIGLHALPVGSHAANLSALHVSESIAEDVASKEDEKRTLRLMAKALGIEYAHIKGDKWLQKFQAVFEQIDVAIAVVDMRIAGLPLAWVNSAFERLTGYSSEEAVGRNCRFLQAEGTKRSAIALLVRAIRAPKGPHASVVVRITNFKKDGTAFNNDVSLHGVFDQAGAYTYSVAVMECTHQDSTTDVSKLRDCIPNVCNVKRSSLPDLALCQLLATAPTPLVLSLYSHVAAIFLLDLDAALSSLLHFGADALLARLVKERYLEFDVGKEEAMKVEAAKEAVGLRTRMAEAKDDGDAKPKKGKTDQKKPTEESFQIEAAALCMMMSGVRPEKDVALQKFEELDRQNRAHICERQLRRILTDPDIDGHEQLAQAITGTANDSATSLREASLKRLLWSGYDVPADCCVWLSSVIAAVEFLPLSVSISDFTAPGNPLIYVNREFCKLYCYDPGDVLGRNARFMQGQISEPESIKRMQAAMRDRESCSVKVCNMRKDGSGFANLLTLIPVEDAHEVCRFYIGVQRRVSEAVGLEKDARLALLKWQHRILLRLPLFTEPKQLSVNDLVKSCDEGLEDLGTYLHGVVMEQIDKGKNREDFALFGTNFNEMRDLMRGEGKF
uniref:PAS domain-containing protein n=2 Tax=Chrysotila carterae TaxID=13221 RepID=A0A7S4BDQ7_CHRCT